MKIALISDIHSNIEALTTALAQIDEIGVDRIICLGDIVGYGADPNPCCELIRERCDVTLMGNHDAAVIGQMNTDYYYDAARDAIRWTRQVMSPENFQWLYSLPYSHVIGNAAFLAPEDRTVPRSGSPPSIMSFSMLNSSWPNGA